MIGKLTGIVDHVAADHAIVDVAGVGYLVACPVSTLSRLQAGATVSLMIETRITDETIKLYGFFTADEREWFRLLQTVQNVGARVALNVLSALPPRELERALALGDKAVIGRAQGVGPKLALRIATELKDKAPAMMARSGEAMPSIVREACRPGSRCVAGAREARLQPGPGGRGCSARRARTGRSHGR